MQIPARQHGIDHEGATTDPCDIPHYASDQQNSRGCKLEENRKVALRRKAGSDRNHGNDKIENWDALPQTVKLDNRKLIA